jgi:hydrogenase maturation protease
MEWPAPPASGAMPVRPRTLVIGIGNRDRGDDGVAYEVINAVRRRLGQRLLGEEESGLEGLGGEVDLVFVPQLVPEWLGEAAQYDQLVFVDARVSHEGGGLSCTPVQARYGTAAFTHHMTPETFVALLLSLYDRRPAAFLVSVRGQRFEFGRELSEEASELVVPAAERVQNLALPPTAKPQGASSACAPSVDGVESTALQTLTMGREDGRDS